MPTPGDLLLTQALSARQADRGREAALHPVTPATAIVTPPGPQIYHHLFSLASPAPPVTEGFMEVKQ